MRKLSLALAAILFVASVCAQKHDYRFGKVSEEELRMEVYEPDPEAAAVILYEENNLHYNISPDLKRILDYQVRIKILKPEGTSQADVSLPYIIQKENYSGLDVFAYNLVDGKIVKTPLKKQYVFREQVSDDKRLLKFSVPEVRAGTVIEYRYQFNSDYISHIPSIPFQHDIPVAHLKMTALIPEFFRFNINMKGFVRIQVDEDSSVNTLPGTTYSYNMRELRAQADSIPALKKEPDIWCLNDFRTMIEFELSQIAFPGQVPQNFTTSWKDVNYALSQSSFSTHCRMGNPFKAEVAELKARQSDRKGLAHDILRLVQSKMKWNEEYRLLAEAPRAAANKGTGSSADINFVLMAALRDAGFTVTPILLNPRFAGRLPYTHATINGINTFVLRITLDDGTYAYLDGTNPNTDVNLLPTQLLVDRARVYDTDGDEGWCDLSGITSGAHSVNMNLAFDSDLSLSGPAFEQYTNQAALEASTRYRKAQSEEEYIEQMEKEQNARLEEFKIEGVGSARVKQSYRMTCSPESAGEFIYLNATVLPFMTTNRFKSPKRDLPVGFTMPITYNIRGAVKIPEGYEVEETPKNINMIGCQGDISCLYFSQVAGEYLQFNLRFTLKRVIFLPKEYEDLKSFYGMVADLSNSKIVLRKKE